MTASQTTRGNGKDASDAQKTDIDPESIVTYAERLTAPSGPLAGDEIDVDRVEELCCYIGEAAGIPRGVDADLTLSASTGEGDTKWAKVAPTGVARISVGELVCLTEYENRTVKHEVRPADSGVVNVETLLTGEYDGLDVEHGGIAELTPEQAEAFAAALVEGAEQARNGGAYGVEQ